MPQVERVAVVTHGYTKDVGSAVERLRAAASRAGVELIFDEEEAAKYGVEPSPAVPDLAVVLGGDGTMLRGLTRFLNTSVPVLGVNFGRVGFLTTMQSDDLEAGLARAFGGDYRVLELPTLEISLNGRTHIAVNDTVVAGGTLGRMIELDWSIGGEALGVQGCDGLICATPPGSTAYNLSNGGPVLVWGLDAMVMTFVAPHTLHIRPLVVPRGPEATITNLTGDFQATVLVDGQPVGALGKGEQAVVRVGIRPSLLATLPEVTFFSRYAAAFGG